MTSHRDTLLKKLAAEAGLDLAEPIVAVPRYQVAVEHAGQLHLAGQLPKLRDAIAVQGRVGAEVSLEEARRAARLCMLRALVAARHAVGTLDRVLRPLRLNVHVQCTPGFFEHSEVADAASDMLYILFENEGGHTRTSAGAYSLPKNAAVELDLLLALRDPEPGLSTF